MPQGTGAHTIGQPLAGADDLEWPAPVFAFALPNVAVEIEASLSAKRESAFTSFTTSLIAIIDFKGQNDCKIRGPRKVDWLAGPQEISLLEAPSTVHQQYKPTNRQGKSESLQNLKHKIFFSRECEKNNA